MSDQPLPNKPLSELMRDWYNSSPALFQTKDDHHFSCLMRIADDLERRVLRAENPPVAVKEQRTFKHTPYYIDTPLNEQT